MCVLYICACCMCIFMCILYEYICVQHEYTGVQMARRPCLMLQVTYLATMCCPVLQRVVVLQCVAVCCGVLQCVSVCCSVLQVPYLVMICIHEDVL